MNGRTPVAILALTAMLATTSPRAGALDLRVEEVTRGLQHPWSLAFLPDGGMLVTEREGRLRLVRDGELHPEPIAGVPGDLRASGQGGLLDVVLDPAFAANGLVYLSYAAGRGDGAQTLRVARGRLEGHGLVDVATIFTAEPWSGGGRHFGSRLAFGADGLLYVTMGDRGDDDRAQDLGDHAGSVFRLHPDGRVPDDNPFVGRAGAKPEIFTYGNRNPQGMAVDPVTGTIWTHEHGPRGGDEVNRLEAGANFGWPRTTHGVAYSGLAIGDGADAPGVTAPLHVWVPSIAPSGLAVYRGEAFPAWDGDLLVGALRAQKLVRVDLEDGNVVGEEVILEDRIGRIRDVRVGPDGFVYLLNDEGDGGLFRLVPAD
jgi:aldose sugar dehydrogenase